MKILALDLGKFNSTCCFFDTKTRKARFLTTPTQPEYLTAVFTDNKADLVVMESCGPSGWINDLAQSLGLSTLVCSTNEEAWRWANVKRKTDKDDALKLARMAAMRELKPVHMPSQEHREFRSLVKYRKTLDGRINNTKNTIRAWFVNQGITIDKGEKAWHTGRERINSFRKPLADCEPNELWKGELDMELTILDSLTEQMEGVVKQLEAIGKADPRIVRLQTVPGVGPRTAEILVACIDDPHHQARQPPGTDDPRRVCLGLAAIQPVGARSLRTDLRQTKDTQEESWNRIGPQDRGHCLGHAQRRKGLGPERHDPHDKLVRWEAAHGRESVPIDAGEGMPPQA